MAEFIYRLKRLTYICTAGLLCAAATSVNVFGQEQSMAYNVACLEDKLSLKSDANETILDRLNALEVRVFGAERSGSIRQRLLDLQTAVGIDTRQVSVPVENLGLNQAPEANQIQDPLPLLNALPPHFLRIDPPNSPNDPQGNYLDVTMTANKGRVLRFKSMPVPVYIYPFPDKNFVRAVTKGFTVWQDGSGGVVKFTQVMDPNQARIKVIWKRLGYSKDRSGCLLGAHTVTKYTEKGNQTLAVAGLPLPIPIGGKKFEVPPQIIEVNLDLIMSKPISIRYMVLQNVVAHELGHALGLLGHSPVRNDIMNTMTDEHSRLSQRDTNTLLKYYKMKVDVPL